MPIQLVAAFLDVKPGMRMYFVQVQVENIALPL
jgi:hypothetical protein